MKTARFIAGLNLAAVLVASVSVAQPSAKTGPDTCRDAFSCGALSARLAAQENDYPGAFRAIRRGCDIETRAPIDGDSLFACEQYAELLIDAGPKRGGDPARGMAMLEGMCKDRPVSTEGSPSPCGTLAREYNHPPKASCLPRRLDKAAALRGKLCDQGDALSCDALGTMELEGGPGLPADPVKGRAAMDKGCAGSDHEAAGVCGAIGSRLAEGRLGGPPDRNAAMPYLRKSCPEGFRCDLLVEFLLRDGKNDEALRYFDGRRNFGPYKDEWAQKYCKEGYVVMCSRAHAGANAKFAARDGYGDPGY